MAATATAMAIATISPAAPIPSAPFPSLPLGLRLRPQPLLFAASRRRLLHVPKAASWDESVPEDGGDAEESVAAGDDEDEDEKPRPEPVSSSEFQFAAPPEGYVEPAAFDELPPESPEDVAAAYESLYGPAFSGETLLGNNVFEVKVVDPIDMDREQRPNDDFTERVVQVNRVTKVVKGGRQLSYRAIVVVGDMKGHVGVGVGKAKEVTEAITKAAMNGRRNLVTVPLTKYSTFPHRADADYGAAKVMLRPACPGSGVIAGGAVRVVLEMAGVENALGKQLRSKNPLNNARATIKATQMMKQFKDVAEERGIPMEELWK
ncbi:30S ribosomal protein S5, chloroplastic [Zea mays]|uniref:Small ribosomal subunit protein uS5c n=2 Tax=Zea mays TaxID=4577 RepID=A0A8J8XUC9_MAIZE|nr:30S ribosomal protein S5 [Zea mays]PWZ54507.1 30S ribosomal protein S5, chloroplastic [Zea mays]